MTEPRHWESVYSHACPHCGCDTGWWPDYILKVSMLSEDRPAFEDWLRERGLALVQFKTSGNCVVVPIDEVPVVEQVQEDR